MKPEDVHLGDWKRMLFGTAPWWFMLEALFRALVMYALVVLALRLFGKRLSGQMTMLELAIMITLGAIVSAPMVNPDKGFVVGFVLLFTVLLLLRVTGRIGVRSSRREHIIQGDAVLLVADGRLHDAGLREASLSKGLLFAQLRTRNIHHLGELRRVYLEASGLLSILKAETAKPGLSIFTDEVRERIGQARVREGGLSVCRVCGNTSEHRDAACGVCAREDWTDAVALGEPERG